MTKLHRELVIGTSSAKAWATAIDYASTSKKDITFLDCSKIENLKPISFSRWRFQNDIVKKNNLSLIRYRRGFNGFIAFFYSLKFWNKFKKYSLNDLLIENFNILPILKCRIATYMGDRNFDLAETPFSVFRKHFCVAFKSVKFLEKVFKANKFDNLIVYNGREPLAASAIQVSRKYGAKVTILERGSDHGKYQTFNTSPHFHPNWWQLISDFNVDPSESEAKNKVQSFINHKLQGYDSYFSENWNSVPAVATSILIPDEYYIYFTSSTTEFSPFDDFNCKLGYLDQYVAVKELLDSCKKFGKFLLIRRHPNSIGIDGIDREKPSWDRLLKHFGNHQYLGPEETISSYELARSSKAVFVWKSSIGFETLAMNKPTYALGPAKWALEENVRAWNRKSIDLAVRTPKLKTTTIVVKYSQFMALSGQPFHLFKEVHKWGFITVEGKKFVNLTGERIRRKTHDFYLLVFGKKRKRNA